MRTYRKPDGSHTKDAEEHAQAWSDFADEVQEMFPGYAVFGLDPGLSFRPTEPNRYDTFALPLGACKALLEYKKGMKDGSK